MAGRQRFLRVLACFLALAVTVGCTGGPRPVSPSAPEPGADSTATPERAPTPSETRVELTTPVPLPTRMPSVVPDASRTAEPTPSIAVPSTVMPTATPPSLAPTVSLPVPTVEVAQSAYVVTDVALLDGAHGRLYAQGRVGGEAKTLVLSATDGDLLAAYDYAGSLGLDAEHRWLYVDAAGAELVVLDADTGERLGAVQLPPQEGYGPLAIPPQADPPLGQVLAFRQNVVYMADAASGRVLRTIPFSFQKSEDCRSVEGPLPIEWAAFDPPQNTLYVSYLSYVCTPWYGYGIISYDVAAGQTITSSGDYAFNAAVSDGHLYGSSWHRFGIGYLWAWRDGKPWLRSSDWNSRPRFSVDPVRKRLYGVVGGSLGVFDAQTMDLLFTAPMPVEGQLAGFDSAADRLYFLADGQLHLLPAGQMKEPVAAGLTATAAPTMSVDALLVSLAWPDDNTVFGIWGKAQPMDQCYAFAQQGGALLVSGDGGSGWALPSAGLPECRYVSCLAVSPDYARDQTLLVGLVGMGVFRSTVGGRLWRPASVGLGSMSVQELILSPGFALDQTAFVRVATGGPYRSTDGGQTWQDMGLPAQPPAGHLLLSPGFAHDRTIFAELSRELYRSRDAGLTWEDLGVALWPLALSPEFDQDGTILGAVPDGTDLYISRDAGSSWERLSTTPDAGPLGWLSLAPLFAKWGVAFAQSRDPMPTQTGPGTTALYRTSDGGLSWQQLFLTSGEPLGAGPGAAMQFLYAPDVEENRPVYLLTTEAQFTTVPPTKHGLLYRSGDGGITWSVARLPSGVVPTALTLSPDFAVDRLVFVGTADGRVLTVRDDML